MCALSAVTCQESRAENEPGTQDYIGEGEKTTKKHLLDLLTPSPTSFLSDSEIGLAPVLPNTTTPVRISYLLQERKSAAVIFWGEMFHWKQWFIV